MKKIIQQQTNKGFTLVEVMISVLLFTVVMVVGIGAVLNANTAQKKSQNQRNIMDNLSFVTEDMSRNLRLGSNYRCPADLGNPSSSDGFEFTFSAPINTSGSITADCVPGSERNAIAFDPMKPDPDPAVMTDQVVYIIHPDTHAIYKSIDGGMNFRRITDSSIDIDPLKSGFTVIGTETVGVQPRVIIRLSGKTIYKNVTTPFNIETTVSQRLLEE